MVARNSYQEDYFRRKFLFSEEFLRVSHLILRVIESRVLFPLWGDVVRVHFQKMFERVSQLMR